MKRGFTLLEVMAVVVIIGILSALGYSTLNDLVQTNKAKEAARLITAFVERSLAEGKMRKEPVTIKIINGSTIQAEIGASTTPTSESISNGFSASSSGPNECGDEGKGIANEITSVPDITSLFKIGNETKPGPVCFVVCNFGGNFCGGAVKKDNKNYFTAMIKKGKNSAWGAL